MKDIKAMLPGLAVIAILWLILAVFGDMPEWLRGARGR